MTILDPQLNRRVLTGTGFQVVSRLWSSTCSLLALMLIERSLDEPAFGLYSYYWSLFQIAATAVDFGTFGIGVREMARRPGQSGAVLRTLLWLRTGLATFVSFAIVLRAWLDAAEPGLLVPLAALHLLALGPASLGAWFHVRVHFLPVAVTLIAGSSTFLATSWFLQSRTGDAGAFLAAFGLGLVVQGAAIFLWALPALRGPGRASWGLARAILKESWPIGVSAVVGSLYFWLDTLFLKELAGDATVGEYSKAFRLLSFAVMVPMTFCQALFPVLSRLAVHDKEQMRRVLRKASAFLLAIAAPAAAITPFLGGAVLRILFKDVGEESVTCLKILAFATLPIFLAYPHISSLTALGRQATFTVISLVAGPVKLLVLAILFQSLGLPGAACATLATEILVLTLVMIATRRYLGGTGASPLAVRAIVPAVIAGSGAYLVRGWTGFPALLAGVVLVAISVLLARVLPFDLAAESHEA